MIKLSAVFRV